MPWVTSSNINELSIMIMTFIQYSLENVPEVLNDHMNESEKKIFFFRRIFFSSSEKLTFEKENVIFFNTFFNCDLFYLIVVNFL